MVNGDAENWVTLLTPAGEAAEVVVAYWKQKSGEFPSAEPSRCPSLPSDMKFAGD